MRNGGCNFSQAFPPFPPCFFPCYTKCPFSRLTLLYRSFKRYRSRDLATAMYHSSGASAASEASLKFSKWIGDTKNLLILGAKISPLKGHWVQLSDCNGTLPVYWFWVLQYKNRPPKRSPSPTFRLQWDLTNLLILGAEILKSPHWKVTDPNFLEKKI